MKVWKQIFLFTTLFIVNRTSNAICVFDLTPPYIGPQELTLIAQDISISGDAKKGALVASIQSPQVVYNGTKVDCTAETPIGRNVYPQLGPMIDSAQLIYATNMPGIGLKIIYDNGTGGLGPVPRDTFSAKVDDGMYLRLDSFKLEFYKMSDHLNLSKTGENTILPGGLLVYYWVNSRSPENYMLRLNVGRIGIISTPVCRVEGEKIIDFGTVTSAMLVKNIERDLNFSFKCETDYGSYGATAKLFSKASTPDGFIKVVDSKGNDDRLKIKIVNSSGMQVPLDGKEGEKKRTIDNITTAQFNWTAILQRGSSSEYPAVGAFSGAAEILIEMN